MSKKLFISAVLFGCGLATSLLAATSASFAETSTNVFNDNYSDNYNNDRNRLRSNIIDMSPQNGLSVIRVQNVSDLPLPVLPVFVPPVLPVVVPPPLIQA